MFFTTLIAAEDLKTQLGAKDLCILDCRFRLNDKSFGQKAYLESHIPGAQFADLEQDLSGPIGPTTGRHPLPDEASFRAKLGLWGVNSDSQVVVYDDLNGAMATRFWWMLRWVGHRKVALLDGGWNYWLAKGFPVTSAIPQRQSTSAYSAENIERVCNLMVCNLDEVAQAVEQKNLLLLDARDAARYRGEVEPIDRIPGHIPGALNRPFSSNLQTDGRFKAVDDLSLELKGFLQGKPVSEVVHYCGSGVTACHNLLAFEIAGLSGSRLYPGSYSEWIVDPNRRIEGITHSDG